MKSFFKRSAISLLVLGATGTVYAAQFTGAFLGVEGLYLKPMNGDLDYVSTYPALTYTTLASNNHFNFTNHQISTDHNWDWRIFGGVKFTDNDDVTVSWMRMRNSASSSLSANANVDDSFVLVQPRFLFPEIWQNVRGHVTFDLDDVYAVWGHTINFNNPWSVRYAAGLEYAKLDSDLTVTANAPDGFPVFVVRQPEVTDPISDVGFKSKSEMKGIGPRVEFDMTYHFSNGFALFGKANAALLVAKREISLTPTAEELFITSEVDNNNLQPEGVVLEFAGSDYSNRDVIIPKFGMRLGASYSYTFGQAGAEGTGGTTLIIDAGWQVESFIHAVERPNSGYYDTVQLVPGLADVSSPDTASTKVSNFTNQGLFLGLTVSSDWM